MRDSFALSHDLRSGAAGGICPGVFLSRDGDLVTVAWQSPPDERLVFHHPEGEVDVPANNLGAALLGPDRPTSVSARNHTVKSCIPRSALRYGISA